MNRLVQSLWHERWFAVRLTGWIVAVLVAWNSLIVPAIAQRHELQQEASQLAQKTAEEQRLLSRIDSLRAWMRQSDTLLHVLGSNRISPLPPPDSLKTWASEAGVSISSIQQSRDSVAVRCDLAGTGSAAGLVRYLRRLRAHNPLVRIDGLELRSGEQRVAIPSLRLAWPMTESWHEHP